MQQHRGPGLARKDKVRLCFAAAALFSYWTSLATTWAPVTTLLINRECNALGVVPCTAKAGALNKNGTNDLAHSALFDKVQKQASAKMSQFTLVQGVANVLFCPVIGVISDSLGRKPAILFNLAMSTMAILTWAVVTDFRVLLVLTGLFGMGGGCYAVVGACFAVVADVAKTVTLEERHALFAVVESALWIGLLIGPFAGGLIADRLGEQPAFFVFAAPVGLMSVLMLFFDESLPVKAPLDWSRCNPLSAIYFLSTNPTSLKLMLVCLFAGLGSAGGVAVMTLYCERLFNFTATQVGLAMSIMFGSSAVGLAVMLPMLTRCLSSKWVLISSILWATVVWLAISLCTEGWQFLVLMGCFALNGLYFPVLRSTVATLFGPQHFGLALGAVATIQQITAAVAPSAFSKLYSATVDLHLTANTTVGWLIPAAGTNLGPRITFSLVPAGLSLIAAFIAFNLPSQMVPHEPAHHSGAARGSAAEKQGLLGSGAGRAGDGARVNIINA